MTKTTYKFLIKEDGYAEEDPHYESWTRKYSGGGSDAAAEQFAKNLSADNGNCNVIIERSGGGRWSVWSGFLPRRSAA